MNEVHFNICPHCMRAQIIKTEDEMLYISPIFSCKTDGRNIVLAWMVLLWLDAYEAGDLLTQIRDSELPEDNVTVIFPNIILSESKKEKIWNNILLQIEKNDYFENQFSNN